MFTICISPHERESGFQTPAIFCLLDQESGKVLLVESGNREAWESGIQLKESGISETIEIRNSSSTDKDQARNQPRGL